MDSLKRQGSGVEDLSGKDSHEVGSADLDNALRWFFEAGRIVPDLRNKLAVCVMNCEFVRESHGAKDEDIVDLASEIRGSANEALAGISRLGFLTHARQSSIDISVDDLISEFLVGKNVQYIQSEIIGTSKVSAYDLHLVIEELVNNSLQAVADNEDGFVSVMTGKRVLDGNDCFFIEVTDNGPGIPAEEREKVFYPDVQLGFKGMGLSVVYRAIKKVLGGRLFLISKTGEDSYTKMTVVIPMEKTA